MGDVPPSLIAPALQPLLLPAPEGSGLLVGEDRTHLVSLLLLLPQGSPLSLEAGSYQVGGSWPMVPKMDRIACRAAPGSPSSLQQLQVARNRYAYHSFIIIIIIIIGAAEKQSQREMQDLSCSRFDGVPD